MDIKKLDNLRIKIRNRLIVAIIVGIVTVIYAIIVNIIFIPLFIITSVILGILLTSKLNKEYKYQYKKYFVESSLKRTFDDVLYMPSGSLDKRILNYTGMVDTGDKYISNDYARGTYKNISFSQADVTIQERRERTDINGNKETYYVNIFKGKWMIFDFNKRFKSDLQVRQKYFQAARLYSSQFFEKIELEDVSFNKKFNVYAVNAHEAFYILTPHMMDRMKEIESKIDGNLLFCFVENKLYIGIDNDKDAFEPSSVFFNLNEEKITSKIEEEIKLITMFVDDLQLDNNLFKNN